MYHVYLLKRKKKDIFYIGYTKDIYKRIDEHNAGKSEYTRKYAPWILVYYESFIALEDAKRREKSLKSFGKAYSQLKMRIRDGLNNTSVFMNIKGVKQIEGAGCES